MLPRVGARAVVVAVLSAIFIPGAAMAGRVTFTPSISLRASYNRNITFTEGGSSDSYGS